MLLLRAVPGRAGALSGLAFSKPSEMRIELLPVEAGVVLSGGWPRGAVCRVASKGSQAGREEASKDTDNVRNQEGESLCVC